jgi:tRNA pseudouridine38-40 synthase
MRSLALVIAYDGTEYHGFQLQCAAHGPTVQGSIEAAWLQLFDEPIRLTPAGRTDAGVHAAGQVASFSSCSRIPTDKIGKAMNSLLPRDIRVLEAWETEEGFNARFSAQWKRYEYWVDNRPVPDVFVRRYAYHEPVALDREAMKKAAQALVGRHNFRAFAAAGGTSRTFERTLSHCHIEEERDLLKMSFVGDGFLYNMVRIMAGTLVAFGKASRIDLSKRKGVAGKDDVQEIIKSQNRTCAGDTLPARGLTLRHVEYQARRPSMVFTDLPASAWEDQIVKPQTKHNS